MDTFESITAPPKDPKEAEEFAKRGIDYHLEAVRAALEAGTLDPNESVGPNKNDPFFLDHTVPILNIIAEQEKSDKIFQLYVNQSPPNIKTLNDRKQTVLFYVNTPEKLATLLERIPAEEKIPFLNNRDTSGKTAIHHFLEECDRAHMETAKKYFAMIETIQQAGGDINIQDDRGRTPLDLAQSIGRIGNIPDEELEKYRFEPTKLSELIDNDPNPYSLAEEMKQKLGAISGRDINAETIASIKEEKVHYQELPVMEENKLSIPSAQPFDIANIDSLAEPKGAYPNPNTKVIILEPSNYLEDTANQTRHAETAAGVADATSRALGRGKSPVEIEAYASNHYRRPGDDLSPLEKVGPLTPFDILGNTPDAKKGDLILSYSYGHSEKEGGKAPAIFNPSDREESLPYPITFYATGNDAKLGVSQQEHGYFYHHPRAVSVGAAEKTKDGFLIPEYSEQRPAFVAPLITLQKEELEGTSFSAPYAAALYGELHARYGKSDTNPQGLSFDEIMYAMSFSTDRNIRQKDKPVQFTASQSGLHYSEEAGFGVLNAKNADATSEQMLQMKKGLGSDTPLTEKHPLQELESSEGKYRYAITPKQDMTLNTLYMELHVEGAEIVTPDSSYNKTQTPPKVSVRVSGEEYPVSPSITGEATVQAVRGLPLKAGEIIEITSDVPLEKDSDLTVRGSVPGGRTEVFAKIAALGVKILDPKMQEQNSSPKAPSRTESRER